MGMSTRVMGFRPPDERWKKMKEIYDSCQAGGVEVPREVAEFFNHEAPAPTGVVVAITDAVSSWEGDDADGFEVDITKLPKDVTRLRFFNSY